MLSGTCGNLMLSVNQPPYSIKCCRGDIVQPWYHSLAGAGSTRVTWVKP